MNLLLSNDDGIYSPGLQKLAKKLKSSFNLQVIAPNYDRSGSSHALTINQPLRIHRFSNGDITVISGTPADCVYLGVNFFMQPKPDFVISGINLGSNLGDDVFYSGTIAAAFEGRDLKYSSFAISLTGKRYLCTAIKITCKLLNAIAKNPLKKKYILNINIPDLPLKKIKGFKVTKLGRHYTKHKIIQKKDPKNNKIFWIGANLKNYEDRSDTDFYAIKHGYISVTPLSLNLTYHEAIDPIFKWFEMYT
ncbi:broad specificity 5'(3')-nucleotidase and polyphosphatase [Wigglesworthia glossinidia endosymbiont of Glossina morsitans morsitans (Yale colony)]|uniref:5'/3'-nucleotidase SurE n=1 Tax=Wigglesworthia glossinidia endosymbiont of Glossina morsitans morsitans (Yale colony) TaxID=1142511 RepID=H6Q510_WIGGL|nr:5'/3'-nucleotidase SurE [Wigglesworthia glossinidia]AFA41293.1 broad specificity 5'(3')-nucleotidase and polyphosphatase [Wigglesworthia glossinidia endosymbiont of Glossina morsitans morsitans (Yale colony)]